MEAFGKLGFTFGLGVLTSFYWGWALMTLWGWFAVTAAGLPAIPYVTWVGVSFLWSQLSIMSGQVKQKDLDDANSWGFNVLVSVLKIVISLVALGAAGLVFLLLV